MAHFFSFSGVARLVSSVFCLPVTFGFTGRLPLPISLLLRLHTSILSAIRLRAQPTDEDVMRLLGVHKILVVQPTAGAADPGKNSIWKYGDDPSGARPTKEIYSNYTWDVIPNLY